MRNVLFFVPSLLRVGPSRQLFYLCKNLPVFGWNSSVVVLRDAGEDGLGNEFEDHGISVEVLGMSKVAQTFRTRKVFEDLRARYWPDVIHSHGLRADSLLSGAGNSVARVATIRNDPWYDYPAKFGPVRGRAMAYLQMRAFKRLPSLVACSQAIADKLSEYGARSSVIENGVDIHTFRPAVPEDKQELRQALGLPQDGVIAISVGSLIERKDPFAILNGFLQHECSTSKTLMFVGDGALLPELRDATAKHKNILCLGPVANVADYLKASDLFISASHSEGMPNSVLEALSCGLYCLLTDIQPHREIVDASVPQSGSPISFFPPGQSEKMAAVLDMLSQKVLNNACKDARALIMQAFSSEITAKRYAQHYQSLLIK